MRRLHGGRRDSDVSGRFLRHGSHRDEFFCLNSELLALLVKVIYWWKLRVVIALILLEQRMVWLCLS